MNKLEKRSTKLHESKLTFQWIDMISLHILNFKLARQIHVCILSAYNLYESMKNENE